MFKLVLALQLIISSSFCQLHNIGQTKEENEQVLLVQKYMDEGVEVWEMEDDVRMYANMFKWRYTNLMPNQFRRDFMVNVTVNILHKIKPIISQWKPSTNSKLEEKNLEKMEMIFIGKFFFSNLAWLNDVKRFFKNELRIVNDQQVNVLVADTIMSINKIVKNDPTGKINNRNFNLEDKIQNGLIKDIDNSVKRDFFLLSENLNKGSNDALDIFFANIDRDTLYKEFEATYRFIKQSDLFWEEMLHPFVHLNKTESEDHSLTQEQAYIMNYSLPDTSMMGKVIRNKGVHPDRNGYFTFKDHIVLDWIEDAYMASFALDHGERKTSEYQLLSKIIETDSSDAFWTGFYERAFEDYHIKNQPKTATYHLLTQDTDLDYDADSEQDLDITDKDLDTIYIQSKAYLECMNATSENRDMTGNGFFESQHLSENCSEYAPDIIKVDHYTLSYEIIQHQDASKDIDWIHYDSSLQHYLDHPSHDQIDHPFVQSRRKLMKRATKTKRGKYTKKALSNFKKAPSMTERFHDKAHQLLVSIIQ